MPAPNLCQLSAVPKQEQILLDRGQRTVTPRSTKVNGPSEAGPVTVNRTPPRPGRCGDNPQTKLEFPPLPRPRPIGWSGQPWGRGRETRKEQCVGVPGDPTVAVGGGVYPTREEEGSARYRLPVGADPSLGVSG